MKRIDAEKDDIYCIYIIYCKRNKFLVHHSFTSLMQVKNSSNELLFDCNQIIAIIDLKLLVNRAVGKHY